MASLIDFLLSNKTTDTAQQSNQATALSKQAVSSKTGQSATTQQSTDTTGTTSSKSGSQLGVTSALDEQTLTALRSLIPGLASNAGSSTGVNYDPSGELDLANFVTDRAKGTDSFVSSLGDALETKARSDFSRQVLPVIAGKGNQIGSNANTYTKQITGQANADLEAQIGGMLANLKLQGRQMGSQDLLQAFGIMSQAGTDVEKAGTTDVANLANIVSLIRGSEITQSQTSQEDISQQIARELSSLVGTQTNEDALAQEVANQNTTGTVNQQSSTNATLLDFINAFANLSGGKRTRT